MALPLASAALVAAVATAAAPLAQAAGSPGRTGQEQCQQLRCAGGTPDLPAPPGSAERVRGPIPGEEPATAADEPAVDAGWADGPEAGAGMGSEAEMGGEEEFGVEPGTGVEGAEPGVVWPDPLGEEALSGLMGSDTMGADPTGAGDMGADPMGGAPVAQEPDVTPDPSGAGVADGAEGVPGGLPDEAGTPADQGMPAWPSEQSEPGGADAPDAPVASGQGSPAQSVPPANPDAQQPPQGETVEHTASLLPAFDGLPAQTPDE
ncbi:hypothetical protein [Streptomyces sp. CO7]